MRSKVISKNLFSKANYWLSLTLVLGVMTVIFWFSAQDETRSSSQSGGILNMFINIFIPSYKNMAEAARQNLYHTFHTVFRKSGHCTEYLILGTVSTYHIKIICKELSKKFSFWVPLAVGVLYAATDELHQYFVPGRAMRFYDVAIDSLGVLSGIGIVLFICRLIKKKKKKAKSNKAK